MHAREGGSEGRTDGRDGRADGWTDGWCLTALPNTSQSTGKLHVGEAQRPMQMCLNHNATRV